MRVTSDIAQIVKEAVNQSGFAIAHSTTPSWYGPEFTDVHITHPEGTKEHAIAEWQKIRGISKQETIGLGDGENDLPIFEAVGLKVVVGNAHPNLKKHADHIVADYSQDGLRQTIEQFLIPNPTAII
jgi:hydroxymethylpyrimidine pyrophosphatase-like HAD family hydrolase